MSDWQTYGSYPPLQPSTGESGILRKPVQHQFTPNDRDNLLIFGYACKLFRDDDRAQIIDQGKHLIPWMGDHSLKIDRYDVRGAISDLHNYEAPPGGYTNRLDALSAAEQRAEQLCEEERYLSLYNNDVDEEMYQEEELKRLHQLRASSYGQVAFDYNKESANTSAISSEPTKEDENDDGQPFIPHPNLIIPPDMQVPDTVKQNAIIEKTARFIAAQGVQMEILIKAKQANNAQFEFLNQQNKLNNYYKFVLTLLKNGKYPSESTNDETIDNKAPTETTTVNSSNLQSLHFVPFPPAPINVVPVIKYKPSADCSYTQLISKIKGVPLPSSESTTDPETIMGDSNSGDTINEVHNVQIGTDKLALPTRFEVMPPPIERFDQNKSTLPSTSDGVQVKTVSNALMLAQSYNSNTESEDEEEHTQQMDDDVKEPIAKEIDLEALKLNFPVPSADLQNIIDKTAAYVLKNGKEFEDILRTKNDPRFTFLSMHDQFNRYYLYKVTGVILPVPSAESPVLSASKTMENVNRNKLSTKLYNRIDKLKSNTSKIITPVSFSIKLKDEPTTSLKPVLPQEPSSDEDEKLNGNIITHEQPLTSLTTDTINPIDKLTVNSFIKPIPKKPNGLNDSTVNQPDMSETSIRDSMLELNNDSHEKKEAKRAEDRVKDRLAQIAREKLGLISKEKQLQIERKKRALQFLNQMKTTITKDQQLIVADESNIPLSKDSNHTSSRLNSTGYQNKASSQEESDSDEKTSAQSTVSSPRVDEIVECIEDDSSEKSEQEINVKSKKKRSRSPSTSKSSSKRHKRKKSKRSSKKSKHKFRSRSRSRSREHSSRKHKKHSSRKSSKQRRSED